MINNTIYIGDNLKIMKSSDFKNLQNNVDFIYIDPPYNTKKKFSYDDNNDRWSDDIKKRLIIAKDLMKKTGVIFISIDDTELVHLLLMCYDVFTKKNFLGIFITKQAQRSNAKHINIIHEYVVAFAKDKTKVPNFYIKRMENPNEKYAISNIIHCVKEAFKISKDCAYNELNKLISQYISDTGETWIKNYNRIDHNGNIFFPKDLSTPGKPAPLDIDEIGLHLEPLKTRRWSSKEKILQLHKSNRLFFRNNRPYCIEYLEEATNNVSSILNFYSRFGTNDLKKLNLDGLFDTPKPVELIKFLIRMSQHSDAIILDFYAGSGTTAQAVYELNNEDFRNHKYILIQLDEPIQTMTKSYNFLLKKGIKFPKVSDAMLLRINTFLRTNNLYRDYVLINN